jgi:hypothetical protein
MTLKQEIKLFESLESETSKKSEVKIYQRFTQILTGLEKRNLAETDIQSIEAKLNSLNLESNPENRKKHVKKSLSTFEKYLEDSFSLTTAKYYTNLYSGLGLSFGLLFGVVFLSNLERSLGISLGLIGGVVIGMLIGRSKDAQAAAEGNVL